MRRTRSAFLASLAAAATAAGAAVLLVGTAPQASAATSGLFTTSCGYVGSSAGAPGGGAAAVGGLHDLFGNRSTGARSSYAVLSRAASSCPTGDRTAYWTPALYRYGVRVEPAWLRTSYSTAVTSGAERTEPFPPGLKMVVGDPANTAESQVPDQISWACADNTQAGANGNRPPTDCPSGGIQASITFPSCWTGVTVDGDANRAGHLRFPSDGRCPDTHPRVLPSLRVDVGYPVGTSTGRVTMSTADGSVFAMHAGFWNAWDQSSLSGLVGRCLRGRQDCGHLAGTTAAARAVAVRSTPRKPAQPSAERRPGADRPGGDPGRVDADRPAGTGARVGGGRAGPPPGPAGPADAPAAPPPAGSAETGDDAVALAPPTRPVRPPGDRRWTFVSDGAAPSAERTVSLGVLIALFLTMVGALLNRRRAAPATLRVRRRRRQPVGANRHPGAGRMPAHPAAAPTSAGPAVPPTRVVRSSDA